MASASSSSIGLRRIGGAEAAVGEALGQALGGDPGDEDVDRVLAEVGEAALGEAGEELGPGEGLGCELLERRGRSSAGDLEVAALVEQGVVAAGEAGAGERVEQRQVVAGEQVDGAADGPGADEAGVGVDRGALDAGDARAQGEAGGAGVLRLDAEDGAACLDGVGGGGLRREPLGGEAEAGEAGGREGRHRGEAYAGSAGRSRTEEAQTCPD